MTSRRSQLIELIEQDRVPAEKVNEAVIISKILPDSVSWQYFINLLLTWLGGLALAFSAMFFIAYNWSDLGRFAKFGMVEALIAVAVFAYWKMNKREITAKVALLMASIFLGVLLALYGQTYQTGADPWQLFFTWALLMLPWALMGRSPTIWVLWLGLINLSIVLYYTALRSALWMLFDSQAGMLWILFLFNTLALVGWELLAVKRLWLAERWAIRLLAIASGVSISWLSINAIFDEASSDAWAGLIWITWLASVYLVYRKFKPDLFMLAGGALSVIVVVMSFMSKHMLYHLVGGGFLFMALLIIGMGTGAAVWLRNIQRKCQS